MIEEKDVKKQREAKEQKNVKPGEIKGKIEIPDNRERRDGPGGN